MFRKISSFVRRIAHAAVRRVTSFGKDCVQHTEAVVLLGAASIGINSMMAEVPIALALPAAVNPAMIVPVFAVITTAALVKSAEMRASFRRKANVYRMPHAMAAAA